MVSGHFRNWRQLKIKDRWGFLRPWFVRSTYCAMRIFDSLYDTLREFQRNHFVTLRWQSLSAKLLLCLSLESDGTGWGRSKGWAPMVALRTEVPLSFDIVPSQRSFGGRWGPRVVRKRVHRKLGTIKGSRPGCALESCYLISNRREQPRKTNSRLHRDHVLWLLNPISKCQFQYEMWWMDGLIWGYFTSWLMRA